MLSQFAHFVRTSKGKLVTLIALVVMAVGLSQLMSQTLYRKAEDKSKAELGENTAKHSPGPDNFVTHQRAKPVPPMVLQRADKTRQTLDDFQGAWLVVNFWATWCAPCRKEMPQLDALAEHYQDRGVRVIALSVDRGGAAKPEEFLDRLGVTHLTRLYDASYKSARSVSLIGLPTTLLIDPAGMEIGRLAGEADWNSTAVHDLLDFHLARTAPAGGSAR